MKAQYFHKLTKQTYTIGGQDMSLEKAWKLFSFACNRNGWVEDAALIEVSIVNA